MVFEMARLPNTNPGVKLFTACILWGRIHGTGKSLVGHTLSKIYGHNYRVINNKELHGTFNSWAEGKQFVLGDEITGSDKRADNDLLKQIITQTELTVNAKYMPEYTVADCVNYLFTSNHADSFYLEATDRRFFVHEVSVDMLPDAFYDSYNKWLNSGGASHLFRYLLDVDVTGFSPTSAALRTSSKDKMIADVQSDLGEWAAQLMATPNAILRVGEVQLPGDLFSARELLAVFDPSGTKRVTAPGMARELRKQGVAMVCGGKPVAYSPTARAERYFAIRDGARWASTDIKDVISDLRETKA